MADNIEMFKFDGDPSGLMAATDAIVRELQQAREAHKLVAAEAKAGSQGAAAAMLFYQQKLDALKGKLGDVRATHAQVFQQMEADAKQLAAMQPQLDMMSKVAGLSEQAGALDQQASAAGRAAAAVASVSVQLETERRLLADIGKLVATGGPQFEQAYAAQFQKVQQLEGALVRAQGEARKFGLTQSQLQNITYQATFALDDMITVMSMPGMGFSDVVRAGANNISMLMMTMGFGAASIVPSLVAAVLRLTESWFENAKGTDAAKKSTEDYNRTTEKTKQLIEQTEDKVRSLIGAEDQLGVAREKRSIAEQRSGVRNSLREQSQAFRDAEERLNPQITAIDKSIAEERAMIKTSESLGFGRDVITRKERVKELEQQRQALENERLKAKGPVDDLRKQLAELDAAEASLDRAAAAKPFLDRAGQLRKAFGEGMEKAGKFLNRQPRERLQEQIDDLEADRRDLGINRDRKLLDLEREEAALLPGDRLGRQKIAERREAIQNEAKAEDIPSRIAIQELREALLELKQKPPEPAADPAKLIEAITGLTVVMKPMAGMFAKLFAPVPNARPR